ncbi:Zinc finger PHD-finger [Penicillium soppii]|uniref:Zinc finger PHD-finger n=1 Tax=Penicillium soppii TaxID=69789 RepID=UPI0025465BEC|nr:Zinc finger PHD-finger [Penicillium soppii]KAJ5871197.1 Zinc finger PHD-finger [Penicillium soppii]
MLRTPAFLVDHSGSSTPLARSIEDDVQPNSIRWGSISSTQPVLSGPEQIRVYHEWIDAGKPHNIVCWECRLPDSLIGCQTCCRSYHTACLQDVVRSANNFYCPSCRARGWDQAPPKFPTPSPAPAGSGCATPSVRNSQAQDSPSKTTQVHDGKSPLGSKCKSSGVPRMAPPAWNRIDESNGQGIPTELSPISEMYPELLKYLSRPDDDTDQSVNGAQFKTQLNLMMQEIESHRTLMQEKTNLEEEYFRTQNENTQIKAYLDSRLSRESTIASPSTFSHSIPRPPAQRSERSWDSIALDLI